MFSAFREWMDDQGWQGKNLDKDLLVCGNKIYSPETCLFVSPAINRLLTNGMASRGKYPQGVYKIRDKYRAQISINNINTFLGDFKTPSLAEAVYLKAKSKHIRNIAEKESEPLRSALLRHASLFSRLDD